MGLWQVGRRWLVLMLVVVYSGVACSDDGRGDDAPDGAVMADAFGEAAEAVYDDGGGDRREDFADGAATDDCFVLDADDAHSVVDALGADDPERASLDDLHFIVGQPDQEEQPRCTISLAQGEESVSVRVGTGPADRESVLYRLHQRAEQEGSEVEEIDGETSGLDDDQVLAVSENGQIATFVWVDDGFLVSLSVPAGVADSAEGFRALPVLVDAVAASLDGS